MVDPTAKEGDDTIVNPNPLCPALSFRFWCGAAGCYVQDYSYSGRVEELFEPDGILMPQQCTGLSDGRGEWIYEGDTIEIPCEYDPAPCCIFLVERNPCEPCNMILIGRTDDGLEIHRPLADARAGKIVRRGFTHREH
jgi:hypothetical protein